MKIKSQFILKYKIPFSPILQIDNDAILVSIPEIEAQKTSHVYGHPNTKINQIED